MKKRPLTRCASGYPHLTSLVRFQMPVRALLIGIDCLVGGYPEAMALTLLLGCRHYQVFTNLLPNLSDFQERDFTRQRKRASEAWLSTFLCCCCDNESGLWLVEPLPQSQVSISGFFSTSAPCESTSPNSSPGIQFG